jgi:hypothetical protein
MINMPSFTWRKLGHLFGPESSLAPRWMHTHAQTPSVLQKKDCLRIFFCTRPPADSAGQFVSLIGYVDVELDNLFQIIRVSQTPVLDLGQRGSFDEFGTNPVSVIATENRDVRAYYAGWTRCESVPFNAAIGVAVSHDNGDSFARLGPGPVLSYSLDEPFVIGSPKVRRFNNTWFLHYAVGQRWLKMHGRAEPVYRIRCATSCDGIVWNKEGRDIISLRLGADECQAGADIIEFKGLFHMFFSYRQAVDFRNKDRGYRIGYAVSKDMWNWTRSDSSVGIGVSPAGWDSEMVSYAHVFHWNETLYMLYQGNDVGRSGFGLAVLDSYEA